MPAASAALPAAVHSLGRAALSLADDQHAVMSTIATTEDRVRSAALALQLNPAPQVLNEQTKTQPGAHSFLSETLVGDC